MNQAKFTLLTKRVSTALVT